MSTNPRTDAETTNGVATYLPYSIVLEFTVQDPDTIEELSHYGEGWHALGPELLAE